MQINKLTTLAIALTMGLWGFSSYAQPKTKSDSASPVGLWQTYDLNKTPRSIVQFYSRPDNTISARIVKILPTKSPKFTSICDKCPEPWKGKSKLGMTIIWGLKKQGNKWVNGQVLDTDGGHLYKCEVSLSENGRILQFRPYTLTPAFGKTLNWIRMEK